MTHPFACVSPPPVLISKTAPPPKTTPKASSFPAQEASPSTPLEPRERHDRVAKGNEKAGASKKVPPFRSTGGSRKHRASPESSPGTDESNGCGDFDMTFGPFLLLPSLTQRRMLLAIRR